MGWIDEDLVEPIHAYSFFSVSPTGEIHEQLIYEYLDHDGYYAQVFADDDMYQREVSKLWENMQYYLDRERVEINGQRVYSRVSHVDVFPKGPTSVVAAVFIIDFKGEFRIGRNTIETWLDEEDAPYDFEIIWRFPVGSRVVDIDTLLDHEIRDDIVILWAVEGQHVGGYEKMVFEIIAAEGE